MAKAAKVKIRVSTQPVVVMEAEVARKIRQHARTSMKAEVCGVLIGSTEHERMMVEACIPGNNAAQGGAHVTFTQDTWEHIYKIKDKEFPDHKIVGWYHSHPGFGVFLSEHDLFIQQNFFSNPQQVAWVYDPHTDEEGCFGWVGDKIEKLTAIRVGYSQDIEVTGAGVNGYEEEGDSGLDSPGTSPRQKESREPAWVKWTSMSLGYLATALLGFVLGHQWLAHRVEPLLNQCQELYQRVAPFLSVPGGSVIPETQNPAAPGSQSPTAPVAPGAQTSPQRATQPSGQQEKAPADKGNHGKH
jgi:proteasome lid subunit RPN8/RPN11